MQAVPAIRHECPAPDPVVDPGEDRVVILSAVRTPIGGRRGKLREVDAMRLGVVAARAALERAGGAVRHIGEVIFGNVVQAGAGQNIARQITVHAGLPVTVPAVSINEVCGSSLKALDLAMQAILLGRADAILVGGTENMADTPFLLPGGIARNVLDIARNGHDKAGKDRGSNQDSQESCVSVPVSQLHNSLFSDGLEDAFSGGPMGTTAENVARMDRISREDQDEYAARSQRLAGLAAASGSFEDEIVPVTLPDGTTVSSDETIRADTTEEVLSSLKPAFPGGSTVTAGNSSSINVGASALVVSSQRFAAEHGLQPLATILDVAEVGIDPQIMGLAPRDAIDVLLRRNHLGVGDIDRYEINEAFAATTLAVIRELNIPPDRVNVNGGGIALGHPLGATGARIVTTLCHELDHAGGRYGIAALCVGGGMGLAMLVARAIRATPGDDSDGDGHGARGDAKDHAGSGIPLRYLSPAQRRARLVAEGRLTPAEAAIISGSTGVSARSGKQHGEQFRGRAFDDGDADGLTHLIENGIGHALTPLGVVPGLMVNGTIYDVPLATEEPSVVAAASNGARIVARSGGFEAHTLSRAMIGQVVIAHPRDPELAAKLSERLEELTACANAAHPSIVARGGGVRDIRVRTIGVRTTDPGQISTGQDCNSGISRLKPEMEYADTSETEVRQVPNGSPEFISIDVAVDVRDAMGANIVDTMMEAVAARLRVQYPGERVLLGILSNHATQSLTRVRCVIPYARLVSGVVSGQADVNPMSPTGTVNSKNPERTEDSNSAGRSENAKESGIPAGFERDAAERGRAIAEAIVMASELAQLDPYRAATHNKGIMNGIEAAVLATGNDTRSIEAACHSYAAHKGAYRGLSIWRLGSDDDLIGEMTVPMPIATVGGGSSALPAARAALDIIGAHDAAELGRVIAALGLAQNLAALRALVTDGIQRGHMSLQAHALAVAAGARDDEIDQVAATLVSRGMAAISARSAQEALAVLRASRSAPSVSPDSR